MSDIFKLPGSQLVQLSAIAAVVIVCASFLRKRDSLPLPPGPSRLPLIGSAHHIPVDEKWAVFAEWRKQYGDIIYIDALGTPLIILNSAKAAIDLLDRRGSLYAGRPVLQLAGEMVGWKDAIPFCAYDQRHRESRKLLFSYLSPRRIASKHSILEQKTVEYLLDALLVSPEHFSDHIRKTVAAPLFFLSHGHIVARWPESDPLVDLAQTAVDEFVEAVQPGKFLVDIFPVLQYVPEGFPGTGWKQLMKKWRARAVQLRDDAYLHVKQQVVQKEGTARPSFTAELVEKSTNPTPEEEMLYRWATVAFYSAGADTTVSSMSSFFLMMVLHPDVQKEAQAEIDRVVGRGRLPSFSDREHLPYLEGLIKEIYRTCPVVPLSLPHCVLQDDEYAGYRMPKGAIIMPNIWAMLRDSEIYPSPLDFDPRRYSTSSSELKDDLSTTANDEVDGKVAAEKDNNDVSKLGKNPDPAKLFFGFGRRVCPGQFLADASVWIAAAMTLATFDIFPVISADGKEEFPEAKFSSATISHPMPFRCIIKPRSTEAASLIKEAILSVSE